MTPKEIKIKVPKKDFGEPFIIETFDPKYNGCELCSWQGGAYCIDGDPANIGYCWKCIIKTYKMRNIEVMKK